MKNKRMLILVAVLLLLTATLAIAHLTTRASVPEGTVLVEHGGDTTELTLAQMEAVPVRGTVVNGKGESRTVDAQGISLASVLEQMGIAAFQEVTVIADDEYSAVVTTEEVARPNVAYLIFQEEGGVQLVVFGDANSRRNVSNVVRMVVS